MIDLKEKEKAITHTPYPITNWKHYEWEKGWVMADNSPDIDE
jgi:hypothetical protein